MAKTEVIWLDFEYHKDTGEKNIRPICASAYSRTDPEFTQFFDLRTGDYEPLKKLLAQCEHIGCYSSSAEASGLMAMGLDPLQFNWIDLYFLFALLTNGVYNQFVYGGDNEIADTTDDDEETAVIPLKRKKTRIRKTLLNACLMMGVHYEHDKAATLETILNNESFTDAEWADIKKYCCEDTRVLPELYAKMKPEIQKIYGYHREIEAEKKEYQDMVLRHSKWGARLSIISRQGFPVDMQALRRLAIAHPDIVRYMKHEINATIYPIYVQGKEKYDRKVQLIQYLKLDDSWLRTPSGKYCFKRDVLKASSHPVISELLVQLNNLNSINRFAPDGEVKDTIGSDGVSRAGLIAYGTSTGRNSHKARNYILAMSSWLRCLLRPPKGWAIVAADYGQQEVAIAAALSQDAHMIADYSTGDPYFAFAQSVGAIPAGGNPKTYATTRDLFKATVLGLQFSMGAAKLAAKLTVDTGSLVTEEKAMELIGLHHARYQAYWRYIRALSEAIRNNEPFVLHDGWGIRTDPNWMTSYLNFPVQGTGGVILRRAVEYAQDAGLVICSTLHDSIYAYGTEADAPKIQSVLLSCMKKAADEVLYNRISVRIDAKIITHDELWVEKKGKKHFDLFKHILFPEVFDGKS